LKKRLLQAIDCVYEPAELRPIQEIVDVSLAGEQFFGEAPGGSSQFLGFGKRHAAFGDESQRELDDEAKPPEPARFIINFRLAGSGAICKLHLA